MKALVGAFYQEKALVGVFSVIVKTGCGTDGALHRTRNIMWGTLVSAVCIELKRESVAMLCCPSVLIKFLTNVHIS